MSHRFSESFVEVWSDPTPEKLAALLDPEVLLIQPHRPPLRGKAAVLADFRRLFDWLPGLHGEVDCVADVGNISFIEWRMIVPLRTGKMSIPAVDRFRLRDDLVVERVVYFDQLVLVSALLRNPGLWLGYIKYRLGSR